MYSDFQNYLTEAIDHILSTDLFEDSFTDAVKAQACLMAGINSDEINDSYPEFA